MSGESLDNSIDASLFSLRETHEAEAPGIKATAMPFCGQCGAIGFILDQANTYGDLWIAHVRCVQCGYDRYRRCDGPPTITYDGQFIWNGLHEDEVDPPPKAPDLKHLDDVFKDW